MQSKTTPNPTTDEPSQDLTLTPLDIARFWSKVDVHGRTGGGNPRLCWQWKAGAPKNYGLFQAGGKQLFAHRVAFYLFNDRWPTESILHTCDNPGCVNPAHLREGTALDNKRDCIKHGRCRPIVNSKFTEDEVMAIRDQIKNGASVNELARFHRVSRPTISRIKNGQSWKHLPDAQ